MNTHIINVSDENSFLQTYVPQGYLGVGLVLSKYTPNGLSNGCKASYSMYADMKTIRQGDIIFVHAGERIYGVFRAESEFVEDSAVNPLFQSQNIHYRSNPSIHGSGWLKNAQAIQQAHPSLSDYRQIAISHYVDNGINLSFPRGFDSREVFNARQKGRIISVPADRWRYPDSSRIVRPLLTFESWELIKLLERENSDSTIRSTVTHKNMNGFLPIKLLLDPTIVQDEKIIEGYICENLGRDPNLDACTGAFSSFGNNVPAPGGYTKMMDIFGYQMFSNQAKKFKIIEVKKDACDFPSHIQQLMEYMDLVSENVASGDLKNVEGIFVAREFSPDAISFVSNFNQFGRTIRLVQFDYVPPAYNSLTFNRVA